MQSWMALLVAGMLLGPVVGSSVAYADTPAVSPEFEAVVEAAYEQWNGSLGIRQTCSSGASIVYESLDGRRGEYRTQTGEVVIDPTDSVVGLGGIVVHELSHHTFLACGAFADQDFTAAFYRSQDLPEGRDWFDYASGWSATPAEHFAEAMAMTIAGSAEGGIAVGTETIALISRWLAGAPSVPPVDSYEPVPYSRKTGSATSTVVDLGSGQPATDPLPDVPTSVDLFGELIEFTHTSASVFWLNSWRVIGPI